MSSSLEENNKLISAMPFANSMGINISSVDKEHIVGNLLVRPDLCTMGNIMHGGAIMAFADALGAITGFLNLPDGGLGTTTIESKTNFIRHASEGTTVTGITKAVNIGSRLSVWNTEIRNEEGKLVATVTQSQMTLYPKP